MYKPAPLLFALCAACATAPPDEAPPSLATAHVLMAGEPTAASMLLQARLVSADTLMYDDSLLSRDLPGVAAWGRFEVSADTTFAEARRTPWRRADAANDYHVRGKVDGLAPDTRYYYRLRAGADTNRAASGRTARFRTLPAPTSADSLRFVLISCMNFEKFYGLSRAAGAGDQPPEATAAVGEERRQGFPALEVIRRRQPHFWIADGDNVYYDHPDDTDWRATSRAELRAKWHRQFSMPRLQALFEAAPTYWLKDDHDYRYNDADTLPGVEPSHALGVATFREQVPVVDPDAPAAVTYRTHRVNDLLQLWFIEGRDYRSPNSMPDGPGKSLWGTEQRAWLQQTLRESDATFKVLVSPTPMVGPDDAYKNDNHVNPGGFRHEGDAFFAWLIEHDLTRNFFVLNGDRHWQYHSVHPTANVDEFGCGALVTQNARRGRAPGDPGSTDPAGLIRQPFIQKEPTGGFLEVTLLPGDDTHPARLRFEFIDERGASLYAVERTSDDRPGAGRN
ncbi:MAG: alkaline phosphatase D family protein [Catalinimonas sp.]